MKNYSGFLASDLECGAAKEKQYQKVIDGLYAASKAKTSDQLDKILSKYTALPRAALLKQKEKEITQERPVSGMTDKELDAIISGQQ